MNPEQYNFENTRDAISEITLNKQELINEVKTFHDLLDGAVEAVISSGRAIILKKLEEEKVQIQKDKVFGKINAAKANELERERRSKLSLINNFLITKDSFVGYVFNKNNDVNTMIESLTAIDGLLPLADKLFKLASTRSEVLNFVLNFANEIGAKEFLNKSWQEINNILFYLLEINLKPEQSAAPEEEEESINPEQIAAAIDANESVKKLLRNKVYESSALSTDEKAKGKEPGKPYVTSFPSGLSLYDTYAKSANKSINFFGRKVEDLQQQIDILNQTRDELNKIDITSHYNPFSIVQNQNNVVQVVNVDGVLTFKIDQAPFAGLVQVALQVVKGIEQNMQRDIGMVRTDYPVAEFEAKRYSSAMNLDDLMLAMRLRDELVLSKVVKLRLENNIDIPNYKVEPILFDTLLKRPDSKLREDITSLVRLIVFPSLDSYNSLFPLIKKAPGGDVYSKEEDFVENVIQKTRDRANSYLKDKILRFFSLPDEKNFCRLLVSTFKIDTIINGIMSEEKQTSVRGWTYITCPTCSKSVYYSQYFSRDFNKDLDKEKEDDFSDAIFIPIKKDYTPITEFDLSYYEDGTEKVYKLSGKDYTWLQVKNMITPQDANRSQPHTDEEHREGLLLRSMILEQAGAIKISNDYNYNKTKTKCPFGTIPRSITEARKNLAKGKDGKPSQSAELAVQSFSCGMSFDFDQLRNAKEALLPHEINIAPIKEGVDPRQELKASIDYLVSSEILEEYQRDDFEAELNRRMSGGWKNSNKIFPCPCKYDAESKDNNIKNFRMIAFPITGVVSKDSQTAEYEPPTDTYGNKLDIADGTASYVVCGANVSLSSFSRDPSDPNSIQGLLRAYYQAYSKNNNSTKIYDLINALIAYGVDFNDVLPYMQYLSDFLMKVSSKKISPIDNSALRELVKFATISLYKKPQGSISNESALEILKDLKLVCVNGHSFTVGSSVNFGKSHHAADFTYSDQNKKKIQESKIFELSGSENFSATINLMLQNQKSRFISEITDAQSSKYTNIKNWNGNFDDLRNCYFEYNGVKYIFNDINKYLAWGSFKNKLFYTQEIKESRDKNTATILGSLKFAKRDSVGPDGKVSEAVDEAVGSTEQEDIEGAEFFETSVKSEVLSPDEAAMLSSSEDSDDETVDMKKSLLRKELYLKAPLILSRHHSSVVILIKSALSMIKDFTEVATRLDVYGTLKSDPISLLNFQSEKKEFEQNISSAAKKFILYAESNLDGGITLDDNDLDLFMSEFNHNIDNDYYKYMMVQDLRLYDILGKSVSIFSEKNIYVNISEAIIKSARTVFSAERASRYKKDIFRDISIEIFDDASIKNIKNNFAKSGSKEDVERSISILDKIVKDFRISTGEKGDKKGLKSLQEVTGPESTKLGISNLRAAEYLSRVYAMSSALYMADSLAMMWKKYLTNGSDKYIGYDLISDDAPPTSRDGIISRNADNVSPFIADYVLLLPNMLKESSAATLLEEFENFSEFSKYIDKYESIVNMMTEDYKEILSGMKTVVSSHKYLNDSLDIIRTFILKKVELSDYSSELKKISTNLVSNCMVAPPITTIDLMPGKKYDKFYQTVDSFRRLPLFRAYVVENSYKTSVVYCISESGNKYSDFGNINIIAERGFAIILTRNTQFGSSGEDLTSSITDKALLQNGWHLYKVSSKKINFKNELLSMFYHPYTFAVDEDGNYSIPSVDSKSFSNSISNLNTSSGFMVGKFISSENENMSKAYPPSNDYDYSSDTPGLIVPIDYRLSKATFDSGWRQDHNRLFPLFNARVPVSIPLGDGEGITIDISDFLARDPQDLAKKYLNEIYDAYVDYETKNSLFGVSTLEKTQVIDEFVGGYSSRRKPKSNDAIRIKAQKNALKRECKERIAEAYSKYKSLPLLVHSLRCTSLTPSKMSNSVEEARSAYVPMIDYVTINKILSIKGFSSEFGGHNLWDPEDDKARNTTISAMRDMLINMNNLKDLAKEINNEVRNFAHSMTIDNNKVKIPSGYITLNITPYDLLSPYGDPLDMSVGLYVKIYFAAKKALDSIRSIKGFKDEDLYDLTYSLSTFLIGTPIQKEWKPEGATSFYAKEDAAEISRSFDRLKKKNYVSWKYSIGNFYNISSDLDEAGGLSPARFSIVSDIFPFDGGENKRATEMKKIQDENDDTILGQYNIHGSAIYRGRPDTTELFVKKEDLPQELFSKDEAQKAKAIERRKKDLKNVISTGSLNLSVGVINSAIDYIVKYLGASRESIDEELALRSRGNVKKASYNKFLSRREEKLSAPVSRSISKAASEISKMANEDFIAPAYYLRNISLAAIAALVSQIART